MNRATKSQPRHGFEVAIATNSRRQRLTIYRREARHAEGAYAAAKIDGQGQASRAALLRLAAAVEEQTPTSSKGVVHIDMDGAGNPFLWIETDGTSSELERDIEVLREAAIKEGFAV